MNPSDLICHLKFYVVFHISFHSTLFPCLFLYIFLLFNFLQSLTWTLTNVSLIKRKIWRLLNVYNSFVIRFYRLRVFPCMPVSMHSSVCHVPVSSCVPLYATKDSNGQQIDIPLFQSVNLYIIPSTFVFSCFDLFANQNASDGQPGLPKAGQGIGVEKDQDSVTFYLYFKRKCMVTGLFVLLFGRSQIWKRNTSLRWMTVGRGIQTMVFLVIDYIQLGYIQITHVSRLCAILGT